MSDSAQPDGPQVPSPIAGWPGTGEPAPAEPAADTEAGGTPQQRLLEEASQVANHLQVQATELERREQNLNSQFSQLDQERRHARLAVQQQEEKFAGQVEANENQNREIQASQQAVDERESAVAAREAGLEKVAAELEGRKQSLWSEVRGELDVERGRLADAEKELNRRKEELAEKIVSLDTEQAERLESLERQFAQRTDQLRQELTQQLMSDELRAERKQFDRDQEEWKRRRSTELQELQQSQASHQQEVQKFEKGLAGRTTAQDQELELARRKQERELADARQAFQVEQDAVRSELQQERALLENRNLFQQEHLAKSRNRLESDQTAFRREVQQQRADLARRFDVLAARRRQLDRCRQLLEERETLLVRGQHDLERMRRAGEESLAQAQQSATRARETWQKQRQEKQQEMARQQEHLSAEAKTLEEQRQRIEALREELEGTQRETLELRLAVEESLATLRGESSGAEGDDRAIQESVVAAKKSVEEHYSRMRETLMAQRAEVEAARKQLAARAERQQMIQQETAAQLTIREQRLQEHSEAIEQKTAEGSGSESDWQQLQERWRAEKQQAELIIRDLLKQLGQQPPDSQAA
ncbi:MAG: hypothetical protein QF363_19860 [Planctomycetaceae bacterium]|nr:hypothetical protein [Planctomycetaceae bacterium]